VTISKQININTHLRPQIKITKAIHLTHSVITHSSMIVMMYATNIIWSSKGETKRRF